MKLINSLVQIVDRHIEARGRKFVFKNLQQMTDRELEDIGLPRECLYAKSANQRRHWMASKFAIGATDNRQNVA